jgi:ribosome recycling factor
VLPACFATLIDAVTVAAIAAAIMKSSLQLTPDNKAVLITGAV